MRASLRVEKTVLLQASDCRHLKAWRLACACWCSIHRFVMFQECYGSISLPYIFIY